MGSNCVGKLVEAGHVITYTISLSYNLNTIKILRIGIFHGHTNMVRNIFYHFWWNSWSFQSFGRGKLQLSFSYWEKSFDFYVRSHDFYSFLFVSFLDTDPWDAEVEI